MDLRIVKTFQAIVAHGSFHKAAESLQYSQPTVTMHMKKLESELGVELLERGKQIKLTEAGTLFLPKAAKLLQEYENMNEVISDYLHGDGGYVRIGASEPSASHLLPEILQRFRERFPKVQATILVENAYRLKESLLQDHIDFAICSETNLDDGVLYEPLLEAPMAVLMPEDHPLADEESLSVKQLRDARFLMTVGRCPIRIKVQAICMDNFGDQYQRLEVGSITSLKYYVQAKHGIALAPLVSISPPIPGTVLKKVFDLNTGLSIGLLSKTTIHSPRITADRFMNEIRNSLLAKNGEWKSFTLQGDERL